MSKTTTHPKIGYAPFMVHHDLKDNCGVDETHKGLLEEASYLACLIVDLQLYDFS